MDIFITKILPDSARILALVFVMMVLVDLLNILTRGRIAGLLRGPAPWRQYVIAPLIASLPGCFGAFTAVSLYTHGMISFGALAGAMLAASGDEAFVMLSLIPETAVPLIILLAVLGMATGWVTDKVVRRFAIATADRCPVEFVHAREQGLVHYVLKHVWAHIIRQHLWRTALWTVTALTVVEFSMQYAEFTTIATRYPLAILLTAGLVGLIPESGPHLVFVAMYADHLVPFSVLLTSAIVQDGHGMLPLLAHSVRASVVLKAINLGFGVSLGLAVYQAGF